MGNHRQSGEQEDHNPLPAEDLMSFGVAHVEGFDWIVWSPWSNSPRASGPRRRSVRHVELHGVAQYWISSPRGFSNVAVRHDRRHRHAADDEQAGSTRR